jgi:hypothetical protein
MEADTAEDIFEDVINQTGEVKATQMVNQGGVIKIVANGRCAGFRKSAGAKR